MNYYVLCSSKKKSKLIKLIIQHSASAPVVSNQLFDLFRISMLNFRIKHYHFIILFKSLIKFEMNYLSIGFALKILKEIIDCYKKIHWPKLPLFNFFGSNSSIRSIQIIPVPPKDIEYSILIEFNLRSFERKTRMALYKIRTASYSFECIAYEGELHYAINTSLFQQNQKGQNSKFKK